MQTGANRSRLQRVTLALAALSLCCLTATIGRAQDRTQSQQPPFRGGLNQVKDADRPHPVRNDVAQPGDEIVTLRYF